MPPTKVGLSDVKGWDVLQRLLPLHAAWFWIFALLPLSQITHTHAVTAKFYEDYGFSRHASSSGRVAHIPNNTHTPPLFLAVTSKLSSLCCLDVVDRGYCPRVRWIGN